MSSATIIFSEEEDAKINLYKKLWDLPKYKTIKKIINDFHEVKEIIKKYEEDN